MSFTQQLQMFAPAAPAIDAALKVTLLLVAAALLARLLHRASAASRHLVWTCALLGALLLPALSMVLPRWQFPVIEVPYEVAHATAPSAEPHANGRTAAMEARLRRSATATTQVEEASNTIAPASGDQPQNGTRLAFIAFCVWAAGVILVLARLAVGLVAVQVLVRRSASAQSAPWFETACQLASHAGVRRVRFRTGRAGTMPMALGVLRPTVIMPADADSWPAERVRIVLLHELAHVKRADCLTHILAQAACALHWVNPFVWLAARRARSERERACDDLVLAFGTPDVHYADQLLEIARLMRQGRFSATLASASLAMAHRSQLEGRLMAILDRSIPRSGLSRLRTLAAATLAATILVPLASMQPWAYAAPAFEQAPAPPAPQMTAPPAGAPQVPAAPPATPSDTPSRGSSVRTAGAIDRAVERSVQIALEATPGMVAAATQRVHGPEIDPNPHPRPHVNGARHADQQPADPRVVAALTSALKDSDNEVREAAMQALIRMRAPNIFEPLVAALADGSADVREHAVFGLGQLRDKRAIGPLTSALKDASPSVREQAVFALGQFRDPTTLDALTVALRDDSASVREQAAFAMGQMRNARAVEPLVSMLKDSSASVREQAAFALGQLKDRAAVDALVFAMKDTTPSVREQAAFALGQLGDPRAIEALTAALKDANADVRQHAAFALGQLVR